MCHHFYFSFVTPPSIRYNSNKFVWLTPFLLCRKKWPWTFWWSQFISHEMLKGTMQMYNTIRKAKWRSFICILYFIKCCSTWTRLWVASSWFFLLHAARLLKRWALKVTRPKAFKLWICILLNEIIYRKRLLSLDGLI